MRTQNKYRRVWANWMMCKHEPSLKRRFDVPWDTLVDQLAIQSKSTDAQQRIVESAISTQLTILHSQDSNSTTQPLQSTRNITIFAQLTCSKTWWTSKDSANDLSRKHCSSSAIETASCGGIGVNSAVGFNERDISDWKRARAPTKTRNGASNLC